MPDDWRRRAKEVERAESFLDFTVAELKAAGESASLTFWSRRTIDEGDVIETSTGRRYLVTAARWVQGRSPHWLLDTIVMATDDTNPDGATVHPLRWFPRGKRKR